MGPAEEAGTFSWAWYEHEGWEAHSPAPSSQDPEAAGHMWHRGPLPCLHLQALAGTDAAIARVWASIQPCPVPVPALSPLAQPCMCPLTTWEVRLA